MRALNSIMVGLLVVAVSMGSQLFALFGPCTTDHDYTFENTISCSNGVCTGQVRITPVQRSCKNEEDSECTQDDDAALLVIYDPETSTNNVYEILLNLGLGTTCGGCVAAIIAITGWSGPGTLLAVAVACGISCQALLSQVDACLFTTCEQDLSTRTVIPGGHNCE